MHIYIADSIAKELDKVHCLILRWEKGHVRVDSVSLEVLESEIGAPFKKPANSSAGS